ncbi:MAG TPA: metabolite traffic protein EboE [Polyangiaceae bacterium]|nr:metabolite traffic protein EboE [Polyangiaceae bacterium]
MQISGAHLTYCTNIHPGESWAQVFENVRTHVLAVKARTAPEQPFGVGLRLSAAAARTLREPATLAEFQAFLAQHQLYVFTINGFPYGPFHAEPVKAAVYRPDWRDAERARYTGDLAWLLAELLPEGLAGSISTVPGGFKAELLGREQEARVAAQLIQQALELHRLRERTGRDIALALEPEPCCMLETTEETLAFFEGELLSHASRSWLARQAQVSFDEAERIVRRHLGVCLDTCHAAIEFERADETLDRLASAGINIHKIQLSTGLRLAEPSPESLRALGAYDEPVYLHQVVAHTRAGQLLRFTDLPQALADREARAAAEWRVHFHVPLYSDNLGAFGNTQAFLARVLERQRQAPVSLQLEVETYTWDVLPPEQRTGSVVASISRELAWVKERLASPSRST